MNTHNLFTKATVPHITLVTHEIPDEFKRYMLLTLIYEKGVEADIFAEPDLEALNAKLCIATNVKAMENISMIAC